MSQLILNEKYLGHVSDPKTNTKVLNVKKHFLKDIKIRRYFKGKVIKYAKAEISDDECWYKFMFGSEKHHGSQSKIDLNRVSRAHWLFSIIDYLNNTPPQNYDQKIEFSSKNKRELVQVNFEKGSYKIILQHLNMNQVMIITSYYVKEKKAYFKK